MKVIASTDASAYKYLNDANPALWSRHAFSTHSKSDMLLNNLTETFNAWIKKSRDKTLLTMLEMIQMQLMTRFHSQNVPKFRRSWKDPKMKQGTVYVDGGMSWSLRLTTCSSHDE